MGSNPAAPTNHFKDLARRPRTSDLARETVGKLSKSVHLCFGETTQEAPPQPQGNWTPLKGAY